MFYFFLFLSLVAGEMEVRLSPNIITTYWMDVDLDEHLRELSEKINKILEEMKENVINYSYQNLWMETYPRLMKPNAREKLLYHTRDLYFKEQYNITFEPIPFFKCGGMNSSHELLL